MKTKQIKTVLSYLTAVVFYLLPFVAEAQLSCRAFEKTKTTESANFVVKNDGTVVHGSRVYASSGMFKKDVVNVDDEKIEFSDIKEFHTENYYYIRHKNRILKRIVSGPKLNVYVYEFVKQTNGSSIQQQRCEFYVQEVSTGKLTILMSIQELKNFIGACPAAYAMIDKKNKELNRNVKENRRYMNEIIELYNNDCKPPAKRL